MFNIANRPIIQYDKNMKIIKEFASQRDAVEETGISDYRMLKSRKNNVPVDGYYFLFKFPSQKFHYNEICENCGNVFECTTQRKSKNKHLFCSRECHTQYIKSHSENNCICDVCGKRFHRKKSQIDKSEKHYCSRKCQAFANSKRMMGENNCQYGLKGSKNSSWKSDERISSYGYKMIRCLEHPFANSDGFVFEHRLVAEKFLLNDKNSIEIDNMLYLSPEFHVHHIDFDRLNNNKENLYVIRKGLHIKFHNSLREIIRDDKSGIIISIKNKKYSKKELRKLFFEFVKNELSDTERGDGGFGSTGK